jgi:DNA polymerase III delta subunit
MPAPSKPFSVVALYGTERVTLLEELTALVESTGALADGGFDYAELDGRSTTPNEILDACATAPFLAERRTVVVRRAHKLDKPATTALTKSLATVPPTALLILVIEPDDDVKDLSKNALVVAALKVGKAIACESPQGAALVKQLIERAKKGGSELTKPGAEELANLVSGSLTLATAELEKLLLYAGGEKIDEQMVRSVASPSQSWKVFELHSWRDSASRRSLPRLRGDSPLPTSPHTTPRYLSRAPLRRTSLKRERGTRRILRKAPKIRVASPSKPTRQRPRPPPPRGRDPARESPCALLESFP